MGILFKSLNRLDFNLTKLKNKYELFLQKIYICLDAYIRGRIKRILTSIQNPLVKVIRIGKFSDDYTVDIPYQACNVLIPNFEAIGGVEHKTIQAYETLVEIYNPKFRLSLIGFWGNTLLNFKRS